MDAVVRYELRVGRLHLGFARARAKPALGWRRLLWRLWFRISPKRRGRMLG